MNLEKLFSLHATACVVAGAGGLLGRECARALRDAGARVFELDFVVGEPPSDAFKVDLTKEKDVEEFFARFAKDASTFRRLFFVNCAYPRTAEWGQANFEDMSLEQWQKNIELHMNAVFNFAKAAVKSTLALKKEASLLHFGSIYGNVGPDFRLYAGTSMKNPSAYAVMKGGIAAFSRYLATTYGAQNIRSNVLSPGGIQDRQPETFIKAYSDRTPLGRMAKPSDIAGVVAFLAGPSAAYISGQEILVDGAYASW